jgi:phospholipase/carboxylesterase
MQQLNGPFRLPTNRNKPDKLVIFLHGLGSNGLNLIPLADEIEEILPNAVFLSPNAPFPYDEFNSGYQWFSLSDISEEKLYQGFKIAAPILKNYIDENLRLHNLNYKDLILIGFSQGTMMALQFATTLPDKCFAVIGFSGTIASPSNLKKETTVKPPIFLCHGDNDQVVPFSKHRHSIQILNNMNFFVEEYIMKGEGHHINMEGLENAKEFLSKLLYQYK